MRERVSFLGYIKEGFLWQSFKIAKHQELLKTRNLGGFISLVFQNTVSKIKAVTDFDACFSQFCNYTYESFIKPSLVASEFTEYLTENKIIYDKNDKMLLDVKLSLNEKYKNESYKSYYLIVNSKLWTNVVGFFQKFIFINWESIRIAGEPFYSGEETSDSLSVEREFEEKRAPHNTFHDRYFYLMNEAKKMLSIF